jgi:hypothetical protein
MPARRALSPGLTRRRWCQAVLGCALILGVTACGQPGTQAPLAQAKKLDEATSAISVSCGYADQIAAFGGPRASGLATLDASAAAGARKLVSVYVRDRGDVYQGETIKAIVSDSIALLGDCGLGRARGVLQRATRDGR